MRTFSTTIATTIILGLLICAASGSAQTQAQDRTQAIVASFNKSKHAVKERRGIRVEKFKEIHSVPAVKSNPADYSGSYEADMGFRLDLRVDAHGVVTGSGADPIDFNGQAFRMFTLVDGKRDGALLRATKVYADGSRERFEAAFINETERNSESDPGKTTFGLGALISARNMSGLNVERVFYQPKD